jgi:hypothetical protein
MRFRLLAAGLAALVLQGCGDSSSLQPDDNAEVRLASASPDAGALDLILNGKTIARGVTSTRASRPVPVDAGPATAEVRSSGSAAVLAQLPFTLEPNRSYQVMVAGASGAFTAMVSVDTGWVEPPPTPNPNPNPEPGDSGSPQPQTRDYARFRILHAAPHAPALDPYLQPSGLALDTVPVFQPFEYGSLAMILDLIRPAGDYTVEFTHRGTRQIVLDTGPIRAAVGELVTVVLGENADRSLRVDIVRE